MPDPIFAPPMPDDADQYPVHPMIAEAIHSLFTLPKRAIDAAANYTATGQYDPAPIVQAATLPLGAGVGGALKAPELAVFKKVVSKPIFVDQKT